jgi:hypothetical protein
MTYTAAQLSDLEAIRDAARRYSRGVDRLDADEMKSAYWPDAVDDHGAFKGNAHEFVEFCMVAHQRYRSTGHCIFNHQIDLDDGGESARGEIYCVTWLFHKDSDVLDTWYGRYLDRYEKRGDEWRIQERVCVHEGTATRSATPMEIDANGFRQGDFDRPAPGRPIGP